MAAIQGLSERLGKLEEQRLATSGGSNAPITPEDLPPHQQETGHSDVLSLCAEDSVFDSQVGSERDWHTSSLSQEGSARGDAGDSEATATDVLSRVLSAAKVVGLEAPTDTQSPVQGVWVGVPTSRPVVSVPAAQDYLDNPVVIPLPPPPHRSLTLAVAGLPKASSSQTAVRYAVSGTGDGSSHVHWTGPGDC